MTSVFDVEIVGHCRGTQNTVEQSKLGSSSISSAGTVFMQNKSSTDTQRTSNLARV